MTSTAKKNRYKFQLTWRLQTSDTTVTITNDIRRDAAVTLTAAKIAIEKDNGEFEIVIANATGGTLTTTSRWLNEEWTAVSWLKKDFKPGSIAYVVIGADDYIDRQEGWTYSGDVVFSGDNTYSKDNTFTGAAARVDMSGALLGMSLPNLTTVQRTALTAEVGDLVYDTDLGENYQYIGGAWVAVSGWSTQANASTTVAGKVEVATQVEFDAGTATGATWASLVATPDLINKVVNTSTEKTTLVGADLFLLADSENFGINKKVTLANIKVWLEDSIALGWDGSDWALSISSGTTSLTMVAWAGSTGYVEMNYSSVNISWTAILELDSAASSWSIMYIKCQWDFTMSGGTINMLWDWAAWGSGGTIWSGSSWSKGKLFDYPTMTALSNFWVFWVRGSPVSGWLGWAAVNLYIKTSQNYDMTFVGAGWGWGWGGWDQAAKYWWDAWKGGWVIIIEVWGEYNFTGGTITASGEDWDNATGYTGSRGWSGWGWGGSWGLVMVFCKILTSNTWTISVDWWDWWHWFANPSWYTPASWWGWGWHIAAWGRGWNTYWSTQAWETGISGASNDHGSGWTWGTWWTWGNGNSWWWGWGWGGAWYSYVVWYTN